MPYSIFLHQRHYGGAFRQVLDATSGRRGMLECKGTNDGGTARDKALRFQRLRDESVRLGGIPLVAVLGGIGWSRVNDTLGPVVRDTDGRVFTLANLPELLMTTPFPCWWGSPSSGMTGGTVRQWGHDLTHRRSGTLASVRQEPFESSWRRHGPMVLRVCRAVLARPPPTTPGRRRSWPRCGPTRSSGRTATSRRGWSRSPTARPSTSCAPNPGGAVPSATCRSAEPAGVPGGWESDLWDALQALPPKQRQTVAYHYLAGLPYAEVASVLGGTPAAARRAAADGIAALRRDLPGPGDARLMTAPETPDRRPDRRRPVRRPARGRRRRPAPAPRPPGRGGDEAGILDVAYRTLDTPVGSLLLAATEQGLVRVAYAGEDHDAVLAQLADRVSPRVLRAPARLDGAARELEEYFAGRRTRFDLPLDFRLSQRLPAHRARPPARDRLRARPPATRPSPPPPATRGRCAPSGRPARPTRCRWWCPATGWCAATAASASTSAGPTPSGPCSRWRPRHEPVRSPRREWVKVASHP